MRDDKTNERCPHLFYAPIQVTVRHSDTGRTSKQTWKLCRTHFDQALADQMKGYYAWYRSKPGKIAHVIAFEIITNI